VKGLPSTFVQPPTKCRSFDCVLRTPLRMTE
jgi:hypothetical protein